ncbi:hemerythrin domain-containing protein, partial [Rhodovulum sulfidophilum]|nr:hemerythrin domain-containing protein [Rhodovulum sulfidophilum]
LHLRELADAVSELVRGEPAGRDACIGRLQLRLQRFGSCLDRHLIDEEDIVLPILLRHGATLTD